MGNDNASQTLKFAIGLVITMILIAIIVVAFSFGRSHANSAITNMSKDTSQIEESRYTQYDGTVVTGAEVLNIISKFEMDNFCVMVATAGSHGRRPADADSPESGTAYPYIKDNWTAATNRDAAAEAEAIRFAKDPGRPEYINPSSSYYGIIKRDTETKAIQGILFQNID